MTEEEISPNKYPPRPPLITQGFPNNGLKKFIKKSFTQQTFDHDNVSKQSPTQRMRELDLIRLYTPSPEERSLLKIPESVERLNIHSQSHLMLLCGACARITFTSQVILRSYILLLFLFNFLNKYGKLL